jgi:CheY-like chemotaxis protein
MLFSLILTCPPVLRQAVTTAPEPNALSPRTRILPVAPHRRAVVIAWRTSEAAALAEAALPARSLVAAITGAAAGVLIRWGLDVAGQADDGASAISQTRRLRPDVVLLDVLLPDISGFAMAEAPAGDDTVPKIILVSSRSLAAYTNSLLAFPAAAFLRKDEISTATLTALCAPP